MAQKRYFLFTRKNHKNYQILFPFYKIFSSNVSTVYLFLTQQFVDDEPPPPGTDLDGKKDKPTEKINSELASFYSEMASIDTNSMPAAELPTSSSDSVKIPNENTSTEGVLKKKKKKVKKSEPWRSGNLENWINKWQKAQKELDG